MLVSVLGFFPDLIVRHVSSCPALITVPLAGMVHLEKTAALLGARILTTSEDR